MIYKFAHFEVDVDVERTRAFYQAARVMTDDCSCSGCRNFVKAMNFLPEKVTTFFTRLGVDMKKLTEIWVNCTNADGTISYNGLSNVCGKLIAGENAWVTCWEEKDPRKPYGVTKYWEEENTYSITNDFRISFQEDCSLVDIDFPRPVIQLDLSADIPWVLDEVNDYPIDTTRRR